MNKIDKLYPGAVVISACRDTNKLSNELYSNELEIDLIKLGLPYKKVEGCYKGILEISFYVETPNGLNDFVEIHDLARNYEQESVLNIDKNRKASLIFVNGGTSVSIGTFQQVSEYEAKQSGNYTYDPINKGYWVCK